MILDSNTSDKPTIEYPCEWKFKLIGENAAKMQLTVNDILSDFKFDLQASNISKRGKYKSLNLKLTVDSEGMRNSIYSALIASENIKMVL